MMRLLRPRVGHKPPEEMPDTVRDLFENERRLLTKPSRLSSGLLG